MKRGREVSLALALSPPSSWRLFGLSFVGALSCLLLSFFFPPSLCLLLSIELCPLLGGHATLRSTPASTETDVLSFSEERKAAAFEGREGAVEFFLD